MSEIVLLKNPLTGDSIQFVDGIPRARIEFRSLSAEDFEKEMVDFKDFTDEEISEQEAEALAKFLFTINSTLGINIPINDTLKNSKTTEDKDNKSISMKDYSDVKIAPCLGATGKISVEDIVKEFLEKQKKKTLLEKIKDFFRKK